MENKVQQLNVNIELKRKELNAYVEKYGLDNIKTQRLSEELDLLINDFFKHGVPK